MSKTSHIHFVSVVLWAGILALILGLVLPDPSLAETTRYYDPEGRSAGSSRESLDGSRTRHYDSHGRNIGSTRRDLDGRTRTYDESGRLEGIDAVRTPGAGPTTTMPAASARAIRVPTVAVATTTTTPVVASRDRAAPTVVGARTTTMQTAGAREAPDAELATISLWEQTSSPAGDFFCLL